MQESGTIAIKEKKELIFYIKKGNNIAVDPHPEKREDVMSTIVETSRLL
jgi:hypothetical protein